MDLVNGRVGVTTPRGCLNSEQIVSRRRRPGLSLSVPRSPSVPLLLPPSPLLSLSLPLLFSLPLPLLFSLPLSLLLPHKDRADAPRSVFRSLLGPLDCARVLAAIKGSLATLAASRP